MQSHDKRKESKKKKRDNDVSSFRRETNDKLMPEWEPDRPRKEKEKGVQKRHNI